MNCPKFLAYCNNYNDLIMVEAEITKEMIDQIKSTLNITGEISYSLDPVSFINYLIIDCICENNFSHITDIIQKHHGIETSPVLYEMGWEYHKFICINRNIISHILEILQSEFTLEILYIQEEQYYGPLSLYGISARQIMNNLTGGQRSIISEAYQKGYYEIPRRIKMSDLAEKYNLSRQAVETRLRRGENSIMDLVVPIFKIQLPTK